MIHNPGLHRKLNQHLLKDQRVIEDPTALSLAQEVLAGLLRSCVSGQKAGWSRAVLIHREEKKTRESLPQ